MTSADTDPHDGPTAPIITAKDPTPTLSVTPPGKPARPHLSVAIATPLDADLVGAIQAVDNRLDVRYQPDLLPPPRFPSDHRGVDGFRRTTEQESRWRAMLADAEVVFGIPGDTSQGLAELVRSDSALRWLQATAGGAGQQVRAAGLTEHDLQRIIITSSSGVHVTPLAEFAMFGVLAFAKGLPRLLEDTKARRWEHYPMTELAGQTLLAVGLGAIGMEVARLAKAFGMRVLAVNRTGTAEAPDVDDLRPSRFLAELLPLAHAVVVSLPLTDETANLIDARAMSLMREGAVLVNVGRGGVIDEHALIRGLQRGRPAAAALDVFATEPLPPDSPLWEMPNVLISPHTAGLSWRENARIVALFTENLRRYLRGDELLSRVRPTLLY